MSLQVVALQSYKNWMDQYIAETWSGSPGAGVTPAWSLAKPRQNFFLVGEYPLLVRDDAVKLLLV